MNSVEAYGKNVEEATREALLKLNATIDQVEISVLEPGSKGIFGIGQKNAKILATKKFEPEQAAKNFLREIAIAMNVAVEIETKLTERHMDINLKGEDMGVFIGKRGQTLDSLQYLVNLVVNKGEGPFISINLDTENYRKRRKETLENLAHNLAKKVKLTKRSVVLEPMNPYERRIIHSTLQNDKMITTFSEGDEPFRNVVIALKKN